MQRATTGQGQGATCDVRLVTDPTDPLGTMSRQISKTVGDSFARINTTLTTVSPRPKAVRALTTGPAQLPKNSKLHVIDRITKYMQLQTHRRFSVINHATGGLLTPRVRSDVRADAAIGVEEVIVGKSASIALRGNAFGLKRKWLEP